MFLIKCFTIFFALIFFTSVETRIMFLESKARSAAPTSQLFRNKADRRAIHKISDVKISRHPGWRLLNSVSCGLVKTDDGDVVVNRIIGGGNVTLGLFPWMSRLGYVDLEDMDQSPPPTPSFRCGGALITRWHVLTAAHCVVNPSSRLVAVRLGEHDDQIDVDCVGNRCADPPQDFEPSMAVYHPGYIEDDIKHDIALVLINRPATITDWVQTICVPHTLRVDDFVGEMAAVAGWGYYDMSVSEGSRVLRAVNVPIVKTAICKQIYGSTMTVNENQVCGGGVKGEDSCNGDSGGPLMVVKEGGTPRWFVIGVVSYGALSCGGEKVPAIYTRVSAYLPWILDKLVEKPGGPEGTANSTDDVAYTQQKLSQGKSIPLPMTANSDSRKKKRKQADPMEYKSKKKSKKFNAAIQKPYKWLPPYQFPEMDPYGYSPYQMFGQRFIPPFLKRRYSYAHAPKYSRRLNFMDLFSPRMSHFSHSDEDDDQLSSED